MSMHAIDHGVPASKHGLAPLARLGAAVLGLVATVTFPASLIRAWTAADPHGLAVAAVAVLAAVGAAAAFRALDPLRAG